MQPADVIAFLVIGTGTAYVIALFVLDFFWEWFRPDAGMARKALLTTLLFVAFFTGTLSFLSETGEIVRKRKDTPELREAARPPELPRPAVPDVPFPDTSKSNGMLPGEELTFVIYANVDSIRGHSRATPFYAELTVPAGKDGQPPARTFRGLPITVKDKDWTEPIRVLDDFESKFNNEQVKLDATVRLPSLDDLAGRTGELKYVGKVSYPAGEIQRDASKKLFTKVATKSVDETKAVMFITPADRAESKAAWADYKRRVEQSGGPAIVERWEKDKAKQQAEADRAFSASVEAAVNRVYWIGRGLAALAFVLMVLLAWPTRRRAAPDDYPL